MFEVEPNLWLQAFATPWLTALLQAVSFLGYDWIYPLLVLLAGFGARLRPALGIMLALLLAGMATHAIKQACALPRPSDVDTRVLDKGRPHRPLVAHGGGETVFALPSPQARAAIRASGTGDYGFVSGHVAAATAGWFGLLACFGIRRRAAWAGAAGWVLVMALSRMYLGRHFLGDVVGGLLVGLAAVAVATWLLPRESPDPHAQRRWAGLCALAVITTALVPVMPWIEAGSAGRLLGLVATLAMLASPWLPTPRPWPGGLRTLLRLLIAAALYAGVHAALAILHGGQHGWAETLAAHLVLAALSTALVLGGGAAFANRLDHLRTRAVPLR